MRILSRRFAMFLKNEISCSMLLQRRID